MLATPVVGMTSARIHFSEEIGLWEGCGITLILLGLTILSLIRLGESRQTVTIVEKD